MLLLRNEFENDDDILMNLKMMMMMMIMKTMMKNNWRGVFLWYEGAIALDFFNNYAMVKHMAKEIDELLDMCI